MLPIASEPDMAIDLIQPGTAFSCRTPAEHRLAVSIALQAARATALSALAMADSDKNDRDNPIFQPGSLQLSLAF